MLPPPPVLALAASLAQRALSRGARPPTAVRALAAISIAMASGALSAAAAREFGRVGTTKDPMHPDRASTLVTTGANAVSRNPMYVGLVGVLVANAVRRGSWKALLPAVAFTLVVDRLQVATEESAMLATFGADYEAYRAAVPRWLGPASITAARGPVPSAER